METQIVIINPSTAKPIVVDLKDISNLEKEEYITPGIFLFFDGKNELCMFGCSYDNVIEHAIGQSKDEMIYSYFIIKDIEFPLNDDEIDNIYDNITHDKLHMFILSSKTKMPLYIIYN
jgi:hypothetical protein